jgi:hypothetical protein
MRRARETTGSEKESLFISPEDFVRSTIAIALARDTAQNIFVFAEWNVFFDAITDHNGDFLR